MKEQLTKHFLVELFKLSLYRKSILEMITDYLKFEYIPKELQSYKKVLKSIVDLYKASGKVPTIGSISIQHKADADVQGLLAEIQDCKVPDVEIIIPELEKYIKTVRFQLVNEEVAELYNRGEAEKAIALSMKSSAEIHELSLMKSKGGFVKVFRDFASRMETKQNKVLVENELDDSIPFGIDPLDDLTGGLYKSETALWIMRSGVGKSTSLKYTGMHACRLGYDVLHIQAEGSKDEAFDKYTQVWSACSYSNVLNGNLDKATRVKLDKVVNDMMSRQRDLSLYAFEQFDEATMVDIRNLVFEHKKINGKFPDLLLIDSVDLIHPGDGYKYGVDTQSIKMKLQNSSKKIKNLVTECDGMRTITATQTGDIPFDVWNNPDKHITRSDSMGDKNIANSYSYVFTGNQTMDEYKNNTMRIFIDKLRHQKISNRIIPIATAFGYGRFFDRERTRTLFEK